MNYKIGLKLKNAGFPQDPKLKGNGYWHGVDDCYIPTLSELIESCGNKFYKLVLDCRTVVSQNRWLAYRFTEYDTKETDLPSSVYGSTPEEAVANLYLELNKK